MLSSMPTTSDVPPLEKVRVHTRADQVAAQLMRYIEHAGLGPGSRLPSEVQLAKDFGVSRPVVREAIRELTGKGIVHVVNGQAGAIIRPVEIDPLLGFFDRATLVGADDTVLELLEVRRGLEITSAALAARRRGDDDLARLTEVTRAMADHLDDEEHYIDLDVEFHVQLARATGNTMMALLVESIRGALRNAVRRGLETRDQPAARKVVQAIHDDILHAVAAGDADAAERAMARHFDVAITTITARRSAEEDL